MSSDTSSRDEPYVHTPGAVETGGADAADASPAGAEPDADGFGRRGWVLVAVVALCVLVVPGAVYLVPSLPAQAGLPYVAAMLALPMIPALLLGVVAVWSMTAATRGDR